MHSTWAEAVELLLDRAWQVLSDEQKHWLVAAKGPGLSVQQKAERRGNEQNAVTEAGWPRLDS